MKQLNGTKEAAPAYLRTAAKPRPSADKLDKVREAVRAARVLEHRIENGVGLLRELRQGLSRLKQEEIPALMNSAGVTSIGIEAEGNEPPYEAVKEAFYSAGFPERNKDGVRTEDREQKLSDMYDYLEEIGHDDLIKVEVTFFLPRKTTMAAIRRFVDHCMRAKVKGLEVLEPTVKKRVNTQTLTAWLRRQVEQEHFVPDLPKINGFVGENVSIKEK